jgi:hypothetical protein
MQTARIVRLTAVTLAGVVVNVAGAQVSPSKPLLCAVTQVMDCRSEETCERESPEGVNLPRFLRLDLTQKTVATVDQAQRAPVHYVDRVDGHLIVPGRAAHTRMERGDCRDLGPAVRGDHRARRHLRLIRRLRQPVGYGPG